MASPQPTVKVPLWPSRRKKGKKRYIFIAALPPTMLLAPRSASAHSLTLHLLPLHSDQILCVFLYSWWTYRYDGRPRLPRLPMCYNFLVNSNDGVKLIWKTGPVLPATVDLVFDFQFQETMLDMWYLWELTLIPKWDWECHKPAFPTRRLSYEKRETRRPSPKDWTCYRISKYRQQIHYGEEVAT